MSADDDRRRSGPMAGEPGRPRTGPTPRPARPTGPAASGPMRTVPRRPDARPAGPPDPRRAPPSDPMAAQPRPRPSDPMAAQPRPRASGSMPAQPRSQQSPQPRAPQSPQPRAPQSPQPTPQRAPQATAQRPSGAAAPARGKLVLVVEDDEKTRRLLGHVMHKGGYRVALAGDGIAAAGVLKKARPDLILLDLRMPRMDGFQLLELLGRFKVAASIPVVVLTASDSPIDLDRALQLGVADYLQKPISPKALLLKVRALLTSPAG